MEGMRNQKALVHISAQTQWWCSTAQGTYMLYTCVLVSNWWWHCRLTGRLGSTACPAVTISVLTSNKPQLSFAFKVYPARGVLPTTRPVIRQAGCTLSMAWPEPQGEWEVWSRSAERLTPGSSLTSQVTPTESPLAPARSAQPGGHQLLQGQWPSLGAPGGGTELGLTGFTMEVGSLQSQLRSHKPPHKRPYITGPFNTVGGSLWTRLNNVFTRTIQNIQSYRGDRLRWNKWIKIFLKVSQNNIHTSSLLHLIMISSSRSDKNYLNFAGRTSFAHIWRCPLLLQCDVKISDFFRWQSHKFH